MHHAADGDHGETAVLQLRQLAARELRRVLACRGTHSSARWFRTQRATAPPELSSPPAGPESSPPLRLVSFCSRVNCAGRERTEAKGVEAEVTRGALRALEGLFTENAAVSEALWQLARAPPTPPPLRTVATTETPLGSVGTRRDRRQASSVTTKSRARRLTWMMPGRPERSSRRPSQRRSCCIAPCTPSPRSRQPAGQTLAKARAQEHRVAPNA